MHTMNANELVKKEIEAAMASLALRRPIFHSERDFQFELAWELRLQNPKLPIRLERRFMVDEDRFDVDISYKCQGQSVGISPALQVVIEIKLFKTKFEWNQAGEDFNLPFARWKKNRYDFAKDILRLERLVGKCGSNESSLADVGFAIGLGNDSRLWLKQDLECEVGPPYELSEGTILKGGDTFSDLEVLHLKSEYPITWSPYSRVDAVGPSEFKWLMVMVERS